MRDATGSHGLRLIARRRPIKWPLQPIRGRAREPFEIGMHGYSLQHGTQVAHVVGGEAELGAVSHGARELVERLRRDHPPLVMPGLRPGVRKQDEDPAKAGLRERGQQEPCVIDKDADIAELPALHLRQELDHAVLEHLGAEESHIRMRRRVLGQVLAGAEADLEPELGGRDRE